MASSSVQGITSSSSSPPPLYMYDVFLSFRGKDTRNNFTSHLYSNLKQRGIDVYKDDKELERGKTIEPALWKAIEESRFSVIIFSRDYASSPWCLDELVKIVQCMKEKGQTVLPVFYDVDPSDVAEQKGKYKKAFDKHEKTFKKNLENVRIWKDCLSTVANLSGWDVRNRDESESIKAIADCISYKLSLTLPTISKELVGIDSRLEVLNGYIGEETGEAIFIGICGMGGLGKTTIARVLYDRIRRQFEGSSFLANVKEAFAEKDGPRSLQKQLLSDILMERDINICDSSTGIGMIKQKLQRKKILVVLDDVNDRKQLEVLAKEPGWFGSGSRIIITSRDTNVLTGNDDTKIYEAEKLNDDDALKLLSQKAFKNDQPAEGFVELSKQVVGYANGLPLALEVIGSFLNSRSIPEWRGAINRMNEIPEDKINDVLRVSFDGLHESDKKIFLDIACFLKGFKIDRITRILDIHGFHAHIGIPVLIEKSLISVSRDQVWMHDLLQIMGKEIVRCESPKEPGRRSRLWTYEDACLALMGNTGKEKIEAIFLDMLGIEEAQWNMKAFSEMSKLRLLKINNVQLSEGPEDLSNKLRFLEWHSYPSKSLPAGLQVDELVELHMANSSLEQLWYGCKSAVNLKIINLSNSLNLSKTPDLTGIPDLESLNLEGCTSLSEVHPSLGRHKKLQYVSLMDCTSIRILPNNLEMESLKFFTLDGCSKLEKFPDIVGNMSCLMKLCLDGTGIVELSSSIHHLIGLEVLSMNNCKNLESIPSSVGCLKSLKKLDVSGCFELENIPENLGKVESLEEFDLSGTSIRQPPAPIFRLKNLKVLSFDGCKRIAVNPTGQRLPSLTGLCSIEVLGLRACNLREGALPEDIGCLSSLKSLDLSWNDFVSLPRSINQLSGLEMLALEDCRMLKSLPEVPSKVQTVNLNGCISLKTIPDPIKLSSSKRSEFLCLNCWELYNHNGQDSMGLTMLERYLQGLSNPRPGFGIVVPGNEIPGWFNHQSEGPSISVQVPSWSMGFVVCVAFSASAESLSLFCHFKANGRENYPSPPMSISCNSIKVLLDHIWLFYLSFDYLKELQEWQHGSFSDIELSFHSSQPGVKVKNCGVCLLSSINITPQPSAHFIVTSKEAAYSYKSFLAFSSSYHHWMANVFPVTRVTDTSNAFTYLKSDLAPRFIMSVEKEPEKVMEIRSRLFEIIEKSGLSIIIFVRDCASVPWCFEELDKIVGLMDEMRSDTVFPVSYDVDQSKVDDETETYTIVLDKSEENFRENKEKVQRWTNILSGVEISSGSKSGKGAPATQQQQWQQIQLQLHQQRIQHLQLVKQWQGWLQLLQHRQRKQKWRPLQRWLQQRIHWIQKREHLSEQQLEELMPPPPPPEEHLELLEQLVEQEQQLLEQEQQLLEQQQKQLLEQQLPLEWQQLLERQQQLHRQQQQLHQQQLLPVKQLLRHRQHQQLNWLCHRRKLLRDQQRQQLYRLCHRQKQQLEQLDQLEQLEYLMLELQHELLDQLKWLQELVNQLELPLEQQLERPLEQQLERQLEQQLERQQRQLEREQELLNQLERPLEPQQQLKWQLYLQQRQQLERERRQLERGERQQLERVQREMEWEQPQQRQWLDRVQVQRLGRLQVMGRVELLGWVQLLGRRKQLLLMLEQQQQLVLEQLQLQQQHQQLPWFWLGI